MGMKFAGNVAPGFVRPALISSSSLLLEGRIGPHVVVRHLDLQDPLAIGRRDLQAVRTDLDRPAHQVLRASQVVMIPSCGDRMFIDSICSLTISIRSLALLEVSLASAIWAWS